MHLRADVHKFREKPHADPIDPHALDLLAATDSTCPYSGGMVRDNPEVNKMVS